MRGKRGSRGLQIIVVVVMSPDVNFDIYFVHEFMMKMCCTVSETVMTVMNVMTARTAMTGASRVVKAVVVRAIVARWSLSDENECRCEMNVARKLYCS